MNAAPKSSINKSWTQWESKIGLFTSANLTLVNIIVNLTTLEMSSFFMMTFIFFIQFRFTFLNDGKWHEHDFVSSTKQVLIDFKLGPRSFTVNEIDGIKLLARFAVN